MILRTLIPVAVIVLTVIGSSCTSDTVLMEDQRGGQACDTVAVTFSGDIDTIIRGYCAIPGCHVGGTSANGDFRTFAGVREKADNGSIMREVLVERTMPQTGGPLTEKQLMAFRCWLDDGAPNN